MKGKIKILLIEDNSGDVRLLIEMLREADTFEFVVTAASRLSEALKLLKNQTYDVILCDLGLPDSSGLGTLKEILPFSLLVPVVILTGREDMDMGIEAIKIGAQDYLVKNNLNSELLIRSMHYAIERKSAEIRILELLKEKEILLKEVHHRIKNNLSIVMGILDMHAYSMSDPLAANALRDAAGRLRSMHSLYNKLYHAEGFSQLSFRNYLETLVDELIKAANSSVAIKAIKEIDDFSISSNLTFHLGIIINEILTNTIKYAFPDRISGEIRICASSNQKTCKIIFHDNGVGIPKDFDIKNSTGFGMNLLLMMSEQIKGKVKIERDNGTKITVEFPL